MSQTSAGARFRKALTEESPLQIIGTINANHALLAKRAGFKAIYLSGGGVAAGSLGIPDLGITGLEDVLVDVRHLVCSDEQRNQSIPQFRIHENVDAEKLKMKHRSRHHC